LLYNPVNNTIKISLLNQGTFEKLNVYHISGRFMASRVHPESVTEMSVSGWAKGVYVVQGIGKDGKKTEKVVIY
jgi:hypothetical protein